MRTSVAGKADTADTLVIQGGSLPHSRIFRTVRINHLPPGKAVYEIVHPLTFGIITDIRPMVLTPVNGRCTLHITFLEGEAAAQCISHLKAQKSHLGLVGGSTLVLETHPALLPTSAFSKSLYDLTARGTVSRMLRIDNIPHCLSLHMIHQALGCRGTKWNNVIAMETLPASAMAIRVHFNSIKSAMTAFQRAHGERLLVDCRIIFDPDPSIASRVPAVPPSGPMPAWIRGAHPCPAGSQEHADAIDHHPDQPEVGMQTLPDPSADSPAYSARPVHAGRPDTYDVCRDLTEAVEDDIQAGGGHERRSSRRSNSDDLDSDAMASDRENENSAAGEGCEGGSDGGLLVEGLEIHHDLSQGETVEEHGSDLLHEAYDPINLMD